MSKPKKQWMSFDQAHQWMKENQTRLNITSCLDYKNAYKEGKIPHLIPSNPNIEYANRGWKGMPHFLGLEILQYRSFEEAKKWAHEQTERGQLFHSKCWAQMRAMGLIPLDIPGSPERVYKNQGWSGWRNFVGRPDNRRSFVERVTALEVRKYFDVHEGHVSIHMPTLARSKKVDILVPSKDLIIEYDGSYYHRDKFIKDCAEAKDLRDQGYRVVRIREQGRKYKLELTDSKWDMVVQGDLKPMDIADQVTAHLVNLGIIEQSRLQAFKDSENSPSALLAPPSYSSARFVNYEAAKKLAQQLGIKSKRAWIKFVQSEEYQTNGYARVPAAPHLTYPEFETWALFLGTNNKPFKKKVYWDYKKTQDYILTTLPHVTSEPKFRVAARSGELPADIPRKPSEEYKNRGWVSWGIFLGTGNGLRGKKDFLDYEKAKAYVAKHLSHIKTSLAWKEACKNGEIPAMLPKNPKPVYRNTGWSDWGAFLGTGRKKHQLRDFLTYEAAKKYLNNYLPQVKTRQQYSKLHAQGLIPRKLPSNPWMAYTLRGEWKGGKDFFGK